MRKIVIALLGTAALVAVSGSTRAETLTVGVFTEATSMHPLYANWNPNNQIFTHVFSHLIARGHKHEQYPGLALSWKPIDDKTWEFKLRKDVKWHDGSPFTVDDVLFTVAEAKNVVSAGSPGGRYFFGKEYKKIDDYTFHVTTGGPYPTMAEDLAVCTIVSKKHGTGKVVGDYNNGKATIGTGPYKFVEWVKGEQVVLVANKDYWGGGPNDLISKPRWDKIVYKTLTSDPSRVAAMLTGAVDMIDFVPTPDIRRLKADKNLTISESASDRVIYLQLDSGRDISPDVFTNDGKPMFPNPLRDWRVRKAISMAINRDAIVERVMEGSAIAASQMPPPFVFGNSPRLEVEKYDLEGARKLMAHAGYGDGFKMITRGPNDRYINDSKIVETIAGMLQRIGIKSEVITEPKATYFNRMRNYSFMLMGFGTDTGGSSSILTSVVHSLNRANNFGFSNAGYYQNPRADQVIEASLVETNNDKRKALMQEAWEISTRDYGHIPLHYQKNVWAMRKGLEYPGRSDERTIALFVTKK